MYNDKYSHTDPGTRGSRGSLGIRVIRVHSFALVDSLHALQILHVLVYIDSRHACELFVYINLPLLRHTRHSMYSRRLFKSIFWSPIDRRTHRLCTVDVLVFRARVLSIYSSRSVYSLSTLFAFKNWFHAYLAFFEFYAATRFICVYPIAQGCRSTDRCVYANTLHRSTGMRVGLGNVIFA